MNNRKSIMRNFFDDYEPSLTGQSQDWIRRLIKFEEPKTIDGLLDRIPSVVPLMKMNVHEQNKASELVREILKNLDLRINSMWWIDYSQFKTKQGFQKKLSKKFKHLQKIHSELTKWKDDFKIEQDKCIVSEINKSLTNLKLNKSNLILELSQVSGLGLVFFDLNTLTDIGSTQLTFCGFPNIDSVITRLMSYNSILDNVSPISLSLTVNSELIDHSDFVKYDLSKYTYK